MSNKTIKPDYCKRLKKSQAAALSIIEELTQEITHNIFAVITNAVSNDIFLASENACLSYYDENIYSYYRKIIDCYKAAALLYSEYRSVVKTPKIKKILDGTYSVLCSQINQHDDYNKNHLKNPIATEKRVVIGNSISLFVRNFNKVKPSDETLSGIGKVLFVNDFGYKSVIDFVNNIISYIEEECFACIYDFYCEAFESCFKNLNDIDRRVETNNCLELLKKEHEILSSIIIVQINALEQELEKALYSEKDFVERLIAILQAGYQHLSKEVNEITENLKVTKPMQLKTFEDFAQNLSEQFKKRKIISTESFEKSFAKYNSAIDFFKDELSNFATEIIEKEIYEHSFYKSVYELQKQVSEQAYMADEITEAFSEINEYFNENKQALESNEIIKGITETISIKTENMLENKALFLENCNGIIKNYKSEKNNISEDDSLKCKEAAFENWKHEIVNNCNENIDFKKNIIENNEILEQYLKKLEKTQTHYENSLKKLILELKKESILFEISTFEEIINYSVTRLVQSEDENIKDYADWIFDVMQNIETILKKNNIDLIRPKPHEPFNGKEHEVIMAEKNPEFLKGEIIKVLNSGYKQKDVVIIRANVIAARWTF